MSGAVPVRTTQAAEVARPGKLSAIVGTPNRPTLTPVRTAMLQRKCACGGSAGPSGECEECRKKRLGLQRSSVGPAPSINTTSHADQAGPPNAASLVDRTLSTPGRPLDSGVRGLMESRFGQDFSRVRVHDDAVAAESARAVNARAYAVGQHIVFEQGQYQPNTHDGARLLAHELAHTVQQRGLQRSALNASPLAADIEGPGLQISSEGEPSEREATAAADAIMRGEKPSVFASHPAAKLSRSPWGPCPAGNIRALNAEFGQELKDRAIAGGSKKAADATPGLFTYHVAEAAEDYIAAHFKTKGKYTHTNKKPLLPIAKIDPDKQPVQAMINAAFDHFRSGGSKSKNQKPFLPPTENASIETPRNVSVPVDPSAIDQQRADGEAELGPSGAQVKPDMLDFEESRVYDVTTLDLANEKVTKLRGYAKLLEEIRQSSPYGTIAVPSWDLGTTLAPPSRLSYGVQNPADPIRICFGVTDFAQFPGVLAYQVIDTRSPSATTNSTTEPYVIATKSGAEVTLDANPASASTDLLNSTENNLRSSNLIRGLVLKVLKRGKSTAGDRIIAGLVSDDNAKEGAPAPRLSITDRKGEIELKIDPKTRVLSLARNYAGTKFKAKDLSQGTLRKLEIDTPEGAKGTGKLIPSLSIFRGVEFGVEFSETQFLITAGLEEEKLKKVLKPIPGAKLTKAQLELQLYPTFLPKGVVEMELASGKRKILDASIAIKPGATGGLYAEGTLNAYIPGVDKAEGKVNYDGGKWSAFAELQSSQLNLPYVKSGSIKAGFTDKGPFGGGTVDLEIPGGHTATVGFHYRNYLWYFSGRGEFHIKRIGSRVGLRIDYFDGKVLKGEGSVKGFKYQGLTGDIAVHYEGHVGASRPRIWGEGKFDIKKGKVNGSLSIRLLETGKFSGEGSITYEIKQGLIAKAGIAIDENEKVKLLGSLTFPDYILINKFPKPPKDRIDIFRFGPKKIGVPYLSFGPFGLQARVRAGIFANYGIGPIVITGGYIKTVIDNPLDDNPNVDLELGGKIRIPAHFSITGYVSGGLVLDVGIAEAGGEITVSASAIVNGQVAADLWAHYGDGKFEAKAKGEALLKLWFTLCFDARAWASVGVWRFKVSTNKTWHLGHFKYDPGLQLGLKMTKPLYYSSESGFDTDGVLDGIEWIKPNFDANHALEDSFGRVGGDENEGGIPPPNPCPGVYEDEDGWD